MNHLPRPVYIPMRLVERYFKDGVAHAAAELAFFLLFSLFPLLMVLNSLLGLAHLSEVTILNATQFLPEDVQQILVNYMTFLGSNDSVRPLLLGSCLTLYFLSRAVRSIMYSMRRIYRCSTDHTMLHNLLVSLVLTGGLLLLLGASIFLIVVGQEFLQLVMRWFPMLYSGLILVRYLGYPAAICIALVFLMLLYRLVPPVRMGWHAALPGACTSLVGWIVLTRCFAYYVDHMGNYNILYGSIGALMVLMLWLYLTSTTLILGGVLNHILSETRRSSRNSDKA
ncbi:MAG: YihY/virulence factor BrkB family protein [Butyricicoccus sp.]|nr:YihY/virulence factor BrkB family protein [Butyricicoccus pullicaecorum]